VNSLIVRNDDAGFASVWKPTRNLSVSSENASDVTVFAARIRVR
jgi:hypothetical protein